MELSESCRRSRGRRALRLGEAGLMGALSLAAVSFAGAILPATTAGATGTVNCGTLEVAGTGGPYQLSEFTTGNASRSGEDSGGSVAYGGTLAAGSNFTVGQNITPLASKLTAIVGTNETGTLTLDEGSAVVAGTAGTINTNQSGATKTVGGGAASLPFNFASVGSDLTNCSDNYGPNATTTTGTVGNPASNVLGLWGTGSVNVFTVTADQLAAAAKLDVSVPAGSTNLINVQPSADHPSSLSLSGINEGIYYGCPNDAPSATNWNNGNCPSPAAQPQENDNTSTLGMERDDTVWNFSPTLFPSSYALTFGMWEGTVVAPAAAVTLSTSGGAFDGSVLAATLSGGNQTGFDPFGYGEPIPSGVDPLPALPEGLPIALGGLALLAMTGVVVRRHRRSLTRASSVA